MDFGGFCGSQEGFRWVLVFLMGFKWFFKVILSVFFNSVVWWFDGLLVVLLWISMVFIASFSVF